MSFEFIALAPNSSHIHVFYTVLLAVGSVTVMALYTVDYVVCSPNQIQVYFPFLFRVLLDRYAACKSSKDVVEVQDQWLCECEKEHEMRSSQGIATTDRYSTTLNVAGCQTRPYFLLCSGQGSTMD